VPGTALSAANSPGMSSDSFAALAVGALPPTSPPHSTGPGTTTVTTVTQPISSGLPATGADLLLLGVAALGSIGVGAGTVALARRRRNGEASWRDLSSRYKMLCATSLSCLSEGKPHWHRPW
jgi:hypothetical protein